jgi:hypothetical protein
MAKSSQITQNYFSTAKSHPVCCSDRPRDVAFCPMETSARGSDYKLIAQPDSNSNPEIQGFES